MKVTAFPSVMVFCMAFSACAPIQPLSEYTPVVDPAHVNAKRFDRDLVDCREIATKVETEYLARQKKEITQNLLIGAIGGALIGGAIGSNTDYQGQLAASGALGGMAAGYKEGDYTDDLVHNGPRRVVDRCMTERNYQILNDVGRG